MFIAVAADHAGYPLKALVLETVAAAGGTPLDLGAYSAEPSDYPDFARAVGDALRDGRAERGILLCGSGVGVSVAANKIDGVQAGLCHDVYSAHQCVEHDNVNVLCIGPRVIGPSLAVEVVQAFLRARFTGEERHVRRLAKVAAIERARR